MPRAGHLNPGSYEADLNQLRVMDLLLPTINRRSTTRHALDGLDLVLRISNRETRNTNLYLPLRPCFTLNNIPFLPERAFLPNADNCRDSSPKNVESSIIIGSYEKRPDGQKCLALKTKKPNEIAVSGLERLLIYLGSTARNIGH